MRSIASFLIFMFSFAALAKNPTAFTSQCGRTQFFAEHAVFSPVLTQLKGNFVLVDKSRKLLHLFSGADLIRSYHVAIGSGALGPKREEGDNKTPEGLYNIGVKNEASQYHLSLEITYPNADDLKWARNHGVNPGGEIMIHGLPNNAFEHPFLGHPARNWTKGCVAVTDSEIEEIWRLVATDTPVELCP